jgi:hypothetical protein
MLNKPVHDRRLFDALIENMRSVEPSMRTGSMFGCPAVFVGRRLAFCVFGSAVGAKIPAADAARLIAANDATPFRPFGRPPMNEWIELQASPENARKLTPILSLALRHAKQGE